MLTHTQARVLAHLDRRIKEQGGVCPSYREIMADLDIKSTSTLWRVVDSLIRRGMVRRTGGVRRTLEVLRRPGEEGDRMALLERRNATLRGFLDQIVELARPHVTSGNPPPVLPDPWTLLDDISYLARKALKDQ